MLKLGVCSKMPLFLKEFKASAGFDGIRFSSSSVTADSWPSLWAGHTREGFLEPAPGVSPPLL